MTRPRRCPCGSGRLRTECDPAELSLCVWGDCDHVFHRHSNRHKYCPEHGREARRAANRRAAAKIYEAKRGARAAREEAVIAAAAQRRARRRPSPEQTTLEVGS